MKSAPVPALSLRHGRREVQDSSEKLVSAVLASRTSSFYPAPLYRAFRRKIGDSKIR